MKKYVDEEKAPRDYIIAEKFIEVCGNNKIFSLLEHNNLKKLLIYDGQSGCFNSYGLDNFAIALSKKFQNTPLEKYLSLSISKGAFFRILTNADLQIDLKQFDNQDCYLNVLNGVVDLRTMDLLDHDAKYKFTSVIDCKYKKSYAKSEKYPVKFKLMLERHFPRKEDRDLFLETFAYLLSWKYGLKIAPFWIGAPHTGKSTFEFLLNSYLRQSVTHHSLSQIASKHGPADLEGVRVNICAEIEKTTIKNMDNFKAIIGNDQISIEPKFCQLHSMQGRCKILLVGNGFMSLAKGVAEPALFDRILPIKFQNPYNGEEKIPLYGKKLLKLEKMKIFAVIVRTLCKLHNNNYRFTHSELSDNEKRRFIRQNSPSDSVEYFIADVCEFVPDYFTPSASIYADYEKYCNVNGFDVERKNAFFVKFASQCDIKSSRTRDNFTHKQRRGYKGIKIRREDIYPGTPSRL